jgi:hypothetical protein
VPLLPRMHSMCGHQAAARTVGLVFDSQGCCLCQFCCVVNLVGYGDAVLGCSTPAAMSSVAAPDPVLHLSCVCCWGCRCGSTSASPQHVLHRKAGGAPHLRVGLVLAQRSQQAQRSKSLSSSTKCWWFQQQQQQWQLLPRPAHSGMYLACRRSSGVSRCAVSDRTAIQVTSAQQLLVAVAAAASQHQPPRQQLQQPGLLRKPRSLSRLLPLQLPS